jgi:hypothetical protein
MSEKPKLDLGVLEEDDEFEEFPVEGKFEVRCNDLQQYLYRFFYRLDRERQRRARYQCVGR